MFSTRSLVVIATLCLGFALALPVEDSSFAMDVTPFAADPNYRLSTNVMPDSYKISLKPYLMETDGDKRFTFDGEVQIQVTVKVATNILEMHAKNLAISVQEYRDTLVGNPKHMPTLEHNQTTDIIKFNLDSTWAVGAVKYLTFKYTGTMDDDMHGFYRSSYLDANNKTK